LVRLAKNIMDWSVNAECRLHVNFRDIPQKM
jgi:hypothetical protein